MKLTLFAILTFVAASAFSYEKITSRELQFENKKVKVWKTTIYPNSPLSFHRHDRDRIVYAIKGGRLLKIEEDGSTSDLIFETEKAYFLEKDPKNELHADTNEEEYPIEVLVIELKD